MNRQTVRTVSQSQTVHQKILMRNIPVPESPGRRVILHTRIYFRIHLQKHFRHGLIVFFHFICFFKQIFTVCLKKLRFRLRLLFFLVPDANQRPPYSNDG